MCNVLVVDDEADFRSVVARVLEDEGHRTQVAWNGAEALRLIEQEPPDIVLADLRMPVMDGWGLIQEIRRRQLDTDVIIMTAAADASAWADELNVPAYIAKPFTFYALTELIDSRCSELLSAG